MKIKVSYKYKVSESFFGDVYENLTEEQVKQIEKRYSDNMKNGEYVALFIEIDKSN